MRSATLRVSVIPLDLDSHDISPELVVRGIQDVGTIHHVILSCELNCFGNLPFNAKLPIIDEVSRGVALEFLTALVVLPFDEREHDSPRSTIVFVCGLDIATVERGVRNQPLSVV